LLIITLVLCPLHGGHAPSYLIRRMIKLYAISKAFRP
jgi:hypothetical protein